MVQAISSATTKSSSFTTTSTTAKPVPADKHPSANQQKCYVNYLGERVLVTFKEAYWSDDIVRWRYVGKLSDGYELTCNVDMTTQKAQSFGVNYSTPSGLVDFNEAYTSSISLLAKMGLVYTREELSHLVIAQKVEHGEPVTNRIVINTNSKELQLEWYNTTAGARINRLTFFNVGYPLEWLS
jgi:hypothetical protein